MRFEKGHKYGKGRPKGSKNKHTLELELVVSRFKLTPFEVLMMITNADWKGLGYEAPSKISYSPAGIEFEELYIQLRDRLQAAKEASRYLYSAKQAVSVDVNKIHGMTDEEFEAFKEEKLSEIMTKNE